MLKHLPLTLLALFLFCSAGVSQNGYIYFRLTPFMESKNNYSYFNKKNSLPEILSTHFMESGAVHKIYSKDSLALITYDSLVAILQKIPDDNYGLSFDSTLVYYSFDYSENKISNLRYAGVGLEVRAELGMGDRHMILQCPEKTFLPVLHTYEDANWYNPSNPKEFLNFNEAIKTGQWEGDFYALTLNNKTYFSWDTSFSKLPISILLKTITDNHLPAVKPTLKSPLIEKPVLWKQEKYVTYTFSFDTNNPYWGTLPLRRRGRPSSESTMLYKLIKEAIFNNKLEAYLLNENYFRTNQRILNWSELKNRTSWEFNYIGIVNDPDYIRDDTYYNPEKYIITENSFNSIKIAYKLKTDSSETKAAYTPEWISFMPPNAYLEYGPKNYEMFSVKYSALIKYLHSEEIVLGTSNASNHHIVYDLDFLINNRFIDSSASIDVSIPFFNSLATDYNRESSISIFDSVEIKKLFHLIKPTASIIAADSLYSKSLLHPNIYEFEYTLAFTNYKDGSLKNNVLDSLLFYIVKNKYLKEDYSFSNLSGMTAEEKAINALNLESLSDTSRFRSDIYGYYYYKSDGNGIKKIFIPESIVAHPYGDQEAAIVSITDIPGIIKTDPKIDYYIRTFFKDLNPNGDYFLKERQSNEYLEVLPFPLEQKTLVENIKIKFE